MAVKIQLVLLVSVAVFVVGNAVAEKAWPSSLPDLFARVTQKECGRRWLSGDDLNIVGGDEAKAHSYPWQAAIFQAEGFLCGGTIIDNKWVLTSASCMAGAESVRVTLGAHSLTASEDTKVTMHAKNIYTHPNYDGFDFKNNIAIIELSQPLKWTKQIYPICLPGYSSEKMEQGTEVTITGWGQTDESHMKVEDKLRVVTVTVDDDKVCSKTFGGFEFTNHTVCICTDGFKGSCYGDYGGPISTVSRGGLYYLRGIVSYIYPGKCKALVPQIGTRVIDYLKWIEKITGIEIDN